VSAPSPAGEGAVFPELELQAKRKKRKPDRMKKKLATFIISV
jgi:hypothetical protein